MSLNIEYVWLNVHIMMESYTSAELARTCKLSANDVIRLGMYN